MKIITIDNPDENRRGIYQCYHCLYGVHLTVSFNYFIFMTYIYYFYNNSNEYIYKLIG